MHFKQQMAKQDFRYGGNDRLSVNEIAIKERAINTGATECRELLGKQKTRNDYFFYEGSINGFEECRKFVKFSDFEKRINELYVEERREISKSSLADELLREELKIYGRNEKTDYDEVFKTKGIRTQISFVYEKLKLFRGIRLMKDEIERDIRNEKTRNCYSSVN